MANRGILMNEVDGIVLFCRGKSRPQKESSAAFQNCFILHQKKSPIYQVQKWGKAGYSLLL